MCVHMYASMCASLYLDIYMYIGVEDVCMEVYMYVGKDVCRYVGVCWYKDVCMGLYLCMYVCRCTGYVQMCGIGV
jgi:tetrahydromethanopterin S-methyltransferase subunit G